MDPNKNEQETTPAETTPGTDGWSQFGKVPPRTGAYRADGVTGPQPTLIHPVPEPFSDGTFGTPAVPAQRGRIGVAKKLGTGLALAAMAVGGGVAGAFAATSWGSDTTIASSSSPIIGSPVSRVTTVADVAKAVQPSVVSIQVTTGNGGGEGSGVVLSEDGRILTNNHVVQAGGQGGQMTVKFSDGKTASAKVVGTDPATDLAVIQADNVSGLTKASLGDSDALKVGDYVLAIGSPLGLSGSVTAGIVSALNRTLTVGGEEQGPQQQMPPGWPGDQGRQQMPPPGWPGGQERQMPPRGGQQQGGDGSTTIGGAIQTDASINPGNSGGALVNASGQVVGINTAIATNGGEGSIGVGFSIPINAAKQVAQELIDKGKVSHAFLGVSVTDATGDAGGALIAQITADSPAAKAGLKQGDLITKINETAVEDGNTVVGAVRGFKPGAKVSVSYVRDGQPDTVTVTLAEVAGQ
jgi:putative serine protease PepD